MQFNLNLNQFIKTHVTFRQESLLQDDFEKYQAELNNRINGKKVLVIGGAGTIGSFYIKAILKFKIAKLVVPVGSGLTLIFMGGLPPSTDCRAPQCANAVRCD